MAPNNTFRRVRLDRSRQINFRSGYLTAMPRHKPTTKSGLNCKFIQPKQNQITSASTFGACVFTSKSGAVEL
jgi:hypothetical protein